MISSTNKKSLGYWVTKTDILKKFKDEKRSKQNRFQKKNRGTDYNEMDTSTSSGSGSGSTGNGISKTLLSGKQQSDTLSIEMNMSSELPPSWVEIHHHTDTLLRELTEIKKDVVKLSAQRIRKQFHENGELDTQINNLTTIASKKLREAEANLKRMDQVDQNIKESDQERRIRMNVKTSLAQQIQEMTVDLRRQQKGLYDSLKKYDNVGSTGFIHALDPTDQGQGQSQYLSSDVDMYQQIAQERDAEINKIVDMINDLSSIYQQLGHLVLEQGTLIDRIDYNITETKENIKKTNVHLTKAVKTQESPTAKRCILILICLIVIFAFILTLRYSRSN